MAATALEHLPAVERLSPRCIRILGGNPGKFTLQGTNTYLLGVGRRRILIDTGEGCPIWIESLIDTLKQEDATVEMALISHWHADHVGGIKDLLGAFPGAIVYRNNPELPGEKPLGDGDVFRVEGITLTAVHAPGHTKDHMVFLLAEEDAMFTADNVLGQGTAIFEDLPVYLDSLGKMRLLFSGHAYPGHGPVVVDGPGRILQYINHRREREEQVLNTIRTGKPADGGSDAWTAMDIVTMVYRDIPQNLHEAACGGVVQILEKLKRDGRAVRVGEDGWRLMRADDDAL